MAKRSVRWQRVSLVPGLIILYVAAAYSLGGETAPEASVLYLATTTSTYDSGLLDYLLPDFSEKYGVEVRILSLGTGQALEAGKRGDADVVLVHAPASEIKFVDDGYGVERKCVMYNDFVILGPEEDPAGISGMGKADRAFLMIAESESLFVSRGDNSGTNKKEIDIWNLSGIEPIGEWYMDVGAGMGDALRIASEKRAYILADRGTYLAMRDKTGLMVLVEGDERLLNPYGVIAVSPEKNPGVDHDVASDFVDWLMSDGTQDMIAGFRKNGEQLFFPLRGACIGG